MRPNEELELKHKLELISLAIGKDENFKFSCTMSSNKRALRHLLVQLVVVVAAAVGLDEATVTSADMANATDVLLSSTGTLCDFFGVFLKQKNVEIDQLGLTTSLRVLLVFRERRAA